MKDRQCLKNAILLCGESDGTVFKRTFVIVKKLSEGASSICYEAYHGRSGRGVLKEFYPRDAYALERNGEGQLVPSPEFRDDHKRFLKAEKEYVEPYEMLMDAKQNGENQDLSTFIPAFEIYHGCDENGSIIGTTYIWTPEPKLETFDKICDEIHKHPNKNPEHKLVTVLSAIESLAKCICAMHCADMIHRDIKPSNFGFIKRGNETLTQTLSMFDINSVCSVYGKVDGAVGTEGYLEPEARYEAASNQTDIYSIGAALFHAIIVTDEVKTGGYLYNREYYDRLHEMVDESKLIQASEANSHPRLRNILAGILKKCLCERTYRYANCEELLDDLDAALYYALPSDVARRSRSGERWVLTDVEKSLDVNKEKNSFLAIQYHLYEHPLYQCCSGGEETINVLVIGFGNYGQKFLDACLQNGQIRSKKLQVTVVSDDLTDKEIYLAERPELADFFNIDGSLEKTEDTYGDITFEITKLERGNQAANSDILRSIMCEHYDSKRPHYVFIALGEDSLNLAAANACKTAAEVFEMDCVVSYVCEGDRVSDDSVSILCPIYVNEDIKRSALHLEIERMAFNTHLVWEKNLNVDYGALKADFRKTYNHDSCVSNVLALKYKLYSMGIDLGTTSFDEAARSFAKIVADNYNRNIKDELIWIEHRRWVTEKLCLGWRGIQDLEDCAGGITKDEKRRIHVCILKSRPDQKLAAEYKENNYDKWDSASNDELSQLDDLDRMSVELHRMYKRRAEATQVQNLLSGNIISGVRALIEGYKDAVVAFQEWFTCVKDIAGRDETNLKDRTREKVYLYKGLKQAFLSRLESLPDERRKAVEEQVKAFDIVFYPVWASMEYRIWKQDDVALIDHIPFILTYTENTYIVVPYASRGKNEVFGNVAAATVINPERILYLCLIERKQDVRDLLESVPGVIAYMDKKKFRAAVDFVLACAKEAEESVNEGLESELKRLGNRRIRQVKLIKTAQAADAPAALVAYLRQRRIRKRFFALEKNRASLSYMLQMDQELKALPSYRFDSDAMRFEDLSDCDMLDYITKSPYITVSDMMAIQRSASASSNNPEFFQDYKKLWRKYQAGSGAWNALCDTLGKHAGTNDVIASFRKMPKEKNAQSQNYHYILPASCGRGAAKIMCFLKEKEIIESESRIDDYTTDSCELTIVDRYGRREGYDRLFSNVYALMNADDISLYLNLGSHEVDVVFDNLVVSGVKFSGNRKAELIELMEFFKDMDYIINLVPSPDDTVSFTYASKKIKELLTTAGKILEIYTYHKVKELGKFDDVVCSHEINWKETEVRSELDCIITKGFRSLFVECKARPDIEQEFYYRIAELRDKFGINATAVLIADTQEKSFYDNAPVNAMQRKRGSMMNVVTIWKPYEINNIGHTLLKVINGNYINEEEHEYV